MGNPTPKPQYLAVKLLAIRQHLRMSQGQLAPKLQVGHYARLSEYETGRRIPSLANLVGYARAAGIHVEYIIDDAIDLDSFKNYLAEGDQKRGEL